MRKLISTILLCSLHLNLFAGFSPLKLSLFEPISFPKSSTIAGLDIGIFSTKSKSVYGLQCASIYTKSEGPSVGLQIAPVNNAENWWGIQTGIWNLTKNFYGLQFSGIGGNASGKFLGLQVNGICSNDKSDFYGIRLSPIFSWHSGSFHGIQLSGFNSRNNSGNFNGIQLSGFNSRNNSGDFRGLFISGFLIDGDANYTGIQFCSLGNPIMVEKVYNGICSIFESRHEKYSPTVKEYYELLEAVKTIKSEESAKEYVEKYIKEKYGVGVDMEEFSKLSAESAELSKFYGNFSGIQVSLIGNITRNFTGLQASCWNISGDLNGLQLGISNHSKNVKGIQLGIVNTCRDVKGLQIGVVNICQTLTGLQIGGINQVTHFKDCKAFPFMFGINIGLPFQSKSRGKKIEKTAVEPARAEGKNVAPPAYSPPPAQEQMPQENIHQEKGYIYGLCQDYGSYSLKPLGDAAIKVSCDGKVVAKIYTDADGKYKTEPLSPGTYELQAWKQAFSPIKQKISLEDKPIKLDFEMIPKNITVK